MYISKRVWPQDCMATLTLVIPGCPLSRQVFYQPVLLVLKVNKQQWTTSCFFFFSKTTDTFFNMSPQASNPSPSPVEFLFPSSPKLYQISNPPPDTHTHTYPASRYAQISLLLYDQAALVQVGRAIWSGFTLFASLVLCFWNMLIPTQAGQKFTTRGLNFTGS